MLATRTEVKYFVPKCAVLMTAWMALYCLLSNPQTTAKVVCRRDNVPQITSKVLFIVHNTRQVIVEEDWGKMKLNEPEGKLRKAEFEATGEARKAIF